MAAAAATEPIPIMVGIGAGVPVDSLNSFSCISVESDSIAANASVPEAIGMALFDIVCCDVAKVGSSKGRAEGDIAMRWQGCTTFKGDEIPFWNLCTEVACIVAVKECLGLCLVIGM